MKNLVKFQATKCLVLFLFAFVAYTTAEAEDTMPKLIRSLADLFSISTDAASSCVHSTMATIEDMRLFEDSLAEKVDTFGGISIRKASCTLACCAQAQGTMSGSKLQLEVINNVIQNARGRDVDAQIKLMYITFVKQCENEVKNITDRCDVVMHFIRCMSDKVRETDF
ncbi:PREDICTED: uncharacterized protein LOC108576960 [Habropoda laboriosa]|uniref:uncharacterized protein LOC108576960 n=1 Tax=Habropoda laboriosa TaxID=597456 RepID=UPI00083CCD98|nr:PREDICTED: uncharacterized protein LOC108576960 [Habropoda laboriosa]